MMIPCYLYNYKNELGIIDMLNLFIHSTNNYYFVSSPVNGRYPYSLSPTPYTHQTFLYQWPPSAGSVGGGYITPMTIAGGMD